VEKGVFSSLITSSAYDRSVRGRGAGFTVAPNGQLISLGYVGGSGPQGVGGDGQIRAVATQVEGRIPTQFTATQELAKWTPQINRVMSIPGSAASPEIDWGEFDLKMSDLRTIREHVVPPQLLSRVKATFGPKAIVACFSGTEGWASDRSPGWRSARPESVRSSQDYNAFINSGTMNINAYGADNIAKSAIFEGNLFCWIYRASVVSSDPGVFALTKQTAPKGGMRCDDLPLLDSSDPTAWLIAIIVPEKEDFVVYRKLMRFLD
jgi:hypothetical protein